MRLSELMEKCWMEGRGEWDREKFAIWWEQWGDDLLKLFLDQVVDSEESLKRIMR